MGKKLFQQPSKLAIKRKLLLRDKYKTNFILIYLSIYIYIKYNLSTEHLTHMKCIYGMNTHNEEANPFKNIWPNPHIFKRNSMTVESGGK